MKLEVRYERSFLLDLKRLNPADYEKVSQFIFEDFLHLGQLYEIPGLRQIGGSAIYYRFSLGKYLVAMEVTGEIVKFIRILPKPEI